VVQPQEEDWLKFRTKRVVEFNNMSAKDKGTTKVASFIKRPGNPSENLQPGCFTIYVSVSVLVYLYVFVV